MKAATVHAIKKELSHHSHQELVMLCLRLAKFKKENKELLTYLLYEESNEDGYILGIKDEIDGMFEQINSGHYYYIKKSARKILSHTRKHIRYSQKKETEVELLLHFCFKLKNFKPSIKHNKVLTNMYERQIEKIKKTLKTLDDDLQHDYGEELKNLD